jgi:peroxiredoxin
VGISADHFSTLDGWKKANPIKHVLLSDFRRQMLPAYGALETNEASPIYRYAKRAYFIIDKSGTVKYVKVMDNALNLLNPDEVLAAVKAANLSMR